MPLIIRTLALALPLLLSFAAIAWAADPQAAAEPYRLQPGDILQVSVWKETEMQAEVVVRPDGGISFALAGDLRAAGRSVEELRTDLEARLKSLIPDAVVTVAIKQVMGPKPYEAD